MDASRHSDSGMRWYVVQTKPRAEKRAVEHLRNQGFDAWTPTFHKTRRHARRVDLVQAPLFPGYAFVALDLASQAWEPINSTWGVVRLLCQRGRPTPLPGAFMDALLEMTDENGSVTLPEKQLSRGQKLRITGGPFQEYIGTLVDLSGHDRVAVLLSAFGREVTATLDRRFVVPA